MASSTEWEEYLSPATHNESESEEEDESSKSTPETEETRNSEQEQTKKQEIVKSDQVIGRKRSASEMEDGPRPGAAPSGYQGASRTPDVQYTVESEPCEFTVICPVTPKRWRTLGEDADVSLFQDFPLRLSQLSIDFALIPGSKWDQLTRFKNARFKETHEVTYTAGQFVYVNRHMPPPPAPPENASSAEKLKYDKENLWVGVVSEFKALDRETVYVRLFWLYWPEELPMGRQPYHGRKELVMSNQVDIIEAQALTWGAEVSYWDESDDSNKTELGERYWRQTYDINKGRTNPRALSKLRKFCVCGGYDNPERDMYQCREADCLMWNHEDCLITVMEQRAWEQFKKGTLTHETPVSGENEASRKNRSKMIRQAIKRKSKAEKPWVGKLEGKISPVKKLGEDEYIHSATLWQLVPQGKHKTKGPFEPVVWKMQMDCLRCHKPLN
ncbi:uncharacterized protein Z520_05483 [Fonsecaea multimorphosa CBS 102226]|uniref:BAH domain-containing protein n=1 Tax=Fonsecaea multimorphosa CBS 102226 TaxID=1442371 RepID=A0A0D2JZS8_9EURO|nr:uncharacterized protein Z520_05483 [Fonsecaea multimorphosa CBS 102226]KIX99022.1 hypothetical protein Z520_05483 [Fonsecaea multimorphosa CBS 102226]OAL25290.1 hypothetical protein AYO22_05167 [Fonsecaea multimorphosa]